MISLNTYKVEILPCQNEDFDVVKKHIRELCLDDNNLEAPAFIIAKHGEEIVGFGRLRTYDDCQELCSLGVIEPERMKGIGRLLCKALIKKSVKPLYLVAVIPEFFTKLGFTEVVSYPAPIGQKMEYCKSSLWVPEPYVAMKL